MFPFALAAGPGFTAEQIAAFFLALALLLGLAKLLGEAAQQSGLPSVLGELVSGLLLGPTILGTLAPQVAAWLFPSFGPGALGLEVIFTLSAALLLLAAGLEVPLSTVWRQGRSMLLVSAAGIAIPFACGTIAAGLAPGFFGLPSDAPLAPFVLFCGIAFSITALPVIAKILVDLNLGKSDLGAVVISGAMLNDLVGWIGFAVVLALAAEGAAGASGIGTSLGLTAAFLVVMLGLGRPAFHRLLPYVQAHSSWPGGVLVLVIVIGLLCAAFTEWVGIHSIFGAFIAGVVMGDSGHLRQRTQETIHHFIINIFGPLFFASIGLRIHFVESFSWPLVLTVVAIALFGKLGGCWIGARLAGWPSRESLAIGFGMAAQGTMGILLGQMARQAGLIGEPLFVAIIVMALATSLISGPAMQRVLRLQPQRSFADFLSERLFVPALAARTVRDAIRELAERAAPAAGLRADEIDRAVWEREQIVHTGLENQLAVPHARLDGLGKPLVVLARSPNGVDFDAPDGSPARIIALLLTPNDDPGAQIELLDLFARSLQSPATRERVLHARTFMEVRAALKIQPEAGHEGQQR